MLLSNRQRKYMSLLLCLLMLFTIFSWNVQQVHANPVVVVAGKYVAAGILAGMGYVATTESGQDAIGQFVYDNCSVSTRDKLTAIAGLITVSGQYAMQLSEAIFNEISGIIENLRVDEQITLPANVETVKSGIVPSASANVYDIQPASVVSNYYLTLNGSVIQNLNNIYGYSQIYYYKPNWGFIVTFLRQDGSVGNLPVNLYQDPAGKTLTVERQIPATTIALNPAFEPKNTLPPPFWLPVNDMGTITLPTSQDALYDGVPLAPESDVPYTPGETTGTIEGDVGIISGVVGTIGQILSNIWNKILEILSSMVAFFQAIMAWVNSFFSELALTIEAVLTEFFTIPTPFVLPTDMFDGMLDDLLDKTGLSAFDQTFSRLQNLQTGYGSPPEITINLHELMAATTNIGSGFSVPLANKESLVIDFAKLEEVEFWNMSLIDLIRALLSLSMVGMTFNYIYRKVIPDKVIE